jgi:uncharacterized protein (TIGR03083 family)
MTFDDYLSQISDRSAALRSAVAAAPSLELAVPGCPEWTLADLTEHLGGVQMFWAVAVSSADASGPPPPDKTDFESPAGDLVAWSASCTGQLLDALSAAGPSSPSWAWWGASGAPLTASAVARHQVQEAAVHARDAQETVGAASPLPSPVAVDGLAEFLSVPLASLGPWPGKPVRVAFAASDGPTHVADLSASGVALDSGSEGPADLTVRGSASELVLGLYNRVPLSGLRVEGDAALLGELRSWADREG